MENNLHKDKNKEEMEGEELLKKVMRFKEKPIDTDTAQLWARIQGTTGQLNQAPEEAKVRQLRTKPRRLSYIAWAAAASVAILMVFILGNNRSTTVQAALAATETHFLPDESRVTLNAGSSLKYNKKSWFDQREVELKGEGFFKVAKGETFTVNTNNGSVTVLGTAFNVQAWNDDFKVSCEEGRVSVEVAGQQAIIITAGEEVVLQSNGQLNKEGIAEGKVATWRNGLFKFEESSLQQITEELERQFNRTIRFEDATIGQETISAFAFNKNDGFTKALDELKFALSDYEVQFDRSDIRIIRK